MGFHDYCDFVQRNGQTLISLNLLDDDDSSDDSGSGDDDSCGSDRAIVVRIPKTVDIREILDWPLARFRDYPHLDLKYSWDDWDFEAPPDVSQVCEGVLGYRDVLMGDDDSSRPWAAAVWESPCYPGEWLVNFEPGCFDVFVRSSQWSRVPRSYLRCVFSMRTLTMPPAKADACAAIAAGGDWD